eukprot:scaffold142333_cov127-Phaeocystis_antarctica.AAC.3
MHLRCIPYMLRAGGVSAPFHNADGTQPAHHERPALSVNSLAARWPWLALRLKVHRWVQRTALGRTCGSIGCKALPAQVLAKVKAALLLPPIETAKRVVRVI